VITLMLALCPANYHGRFVRHRCRCCCRRCRCRRLRTFRSDEVVVCGCFVQCMIDVSVASSGRQNRNSNDFYSTKNSIKWPNHIFLVLRLLILCAILVNNEDFPSLFSVFMKVRHNQNFKIIIRLH